LVRRPNGVAFAGGPPGASRRIFFPLFFFFFGGGDFVVVLDRFCRSLFYRLRVDLGGTPADRFRSVSFYPASNLHGRTSGFPRSRVLSRKLVVHLISERADHRRISPASSYRRTRPPRSARRALPPLHAPDEAVNPVHL